MHYTLLVGIHGVGKTTLLSNLKEDIKLTALSISDLIRRAGNDIKSDDKFTRNVMDNQELWKQELKEYHFNKDDTVILDGHFTLLNSNREIVELPFSTFDNLPINKVVLKLESPSIIQERLERRYNQKWDIDLISSFQYSEKERAKKFSDLKNIPIFIYDSNKQINKLKKFIIQN